MSSPEDEFLPRTRLIQEAQPPVPTCWPALTDRESADALATLEDWIDWLVDRYHLDHRTVPGCWQHHTALIEELSALHTAWITAYAATTPGDRPLTWHHEFDLARRTEPCGPRGARSASSTARSGSCGHPWVGDS